jgi:hypothetical protein
MQTLSLDFVLKQLHDLGFNPRSHSEAVRMFDDSQDKGAPCEASLLEAREEVPKGGDFPQIPDSRGCRDLYLFLTAFFWVLNHTFVHVLFRGKCR